jgi:hypothetical protein
MLIVSINMASLRSLVEPNKRMEAWSDIIFFPVYSCIGDGSRDFYQVPANALSFLRLIAYNRRRSPNSYDYAFDGAVPEVFGA